jgi:hypothetical protein
MGLFCLIVGRTDGGAPTRPSLALEYTGVEEAVEGLKTALREHEPDGILGRRRSGL